MARIWLIGGAAVLGVLLLASIVVGLTQGEDELPAGTPEGTVQLYLRAAEEPDFNAAHGLLSASLRAECTVEDLAGVPFGAKRGLTDSRVTLKGTKTLNGAVVVTARVTQIRGSGLFGTSESFHEQNYTLRKEGGEWRFTQYPWPHFGCREAPPPRPPLPEFELRPEGTPERVVQRYLSAVGDGDTELVYSFLSEKTQRECPYEEFAKSDDHASRAVGSGPASFATRFDGPRAVVSARLESVASYREGIPVSSFSLAFYVRQELGQWRFIGYPWPYYGCGENFFAPETP